MGLIRLDEVKIAELERYISRQLVRMPISLE